MGKLLYSINEIFQSYIKGQYLIPPYQRGYKWKESDIKQLLNDFNNFVETDNDDIFYCLQNITLIEKGDNVEVVDGQQRLTTIAIILSYLGKNDLVKDKINYQVREITNNFVQEFLTNPDDPDDPIINKYTDWDSFISEKRDRDYNRQDVYYMFKAYRACCEWFNETTVDKSQMQDKILKRVKMIVNLQKETVQAQELFENLNGKRVPLDGADLIRALIITHIATKEVADCDDEYKRIYMQEERRIKLGIQLDDINKWWALPEHKLYFESFINNNVKEADGATIKFDNTNYPINYLYKLLVLQDEQKQIDLDYFEKRILNDEKFLDELLNLHRTMVDWYNDKILYHLVKYCLLYAKGVKFKYLYNDLWKGNSRNKFIQALKNKIGEIDEIKKLLIDKKPEETALTEDWYYDQDLIKISVLLDIISLLDNTKSTAVLPAEYFEKNEEDKEHIFPQTPISDKVKNKQILSDYIELINDKIEKEEEKINIDINEINWNNKEWKEQTKTLINSRVLKIIPIGCLGNLCLLDKSVNRSYGNDHFQEKRIDIMQKQLDGKYIRQHVLEAFNKAFATREDNINFDLMKNWNKEDILNRRAYIVKKIKSFLTIQTKSFLTIQTNETK